MKKRYVILIIIVIIIGISLTRESEDVKNMQDIVLIINNQELKVTLEENTTTKELINILKEKEIVIKAHDYGNFEKVGNLGFNLPTNDKQITTSYGDIVLYNGNEISLFYNSNTWSYTKIGHINNITQEELIDILKDGDVTLTFKLE